MKIRIPSEMPMNTRDLFDSTVHNSHSLREMLKKKPRPLDVVTAMVILACLYFSHRFSYMLFHGLAEVFSHHPGRLGG